MNKPNLERACALYFAKQMAHVTLVRGEGSPHLHLRTRPATLRTGLAGGLASGPRASGHVRGSFRRHDTFRAG